MKNFKALLAAGSFIAMAMVAATPAAAQQTAAGTVVTNNVAVAYKVGGLSQNGLTATDTFTVDRKVNLLVIQDGTANTIVSPGEQGAVTTFLVSNLSNAPIDIRLSAANRTGDDFNVSMLKIFADTNSSGSYDSGDLEVAHLDEVPAETNNRRVFILGNVPLGGDTGDISAVRLTGTAAEPGAIGSVGADVLETTGANTSSVDTVLADTGTANGNVIRDGISYDDDAYEILTAALTALKTSRIISDPLNGTTDPKAIPGAVVEYCIAVNNGGGATATAVDVDDQLPAETVYDSAFGIKVNGTVDSTSGACDTDGASGGSYVDGVVSASIPTITANDTRTVVFRVSVK